MKTRSIEQRGASFVRILAVASICRALYHLLDHSRMGLHISTVKICNKLFPTFLFLTVGNNSNRTGSCPKDCDINFLKEDDGLHSKVRGRLEEDHENIIS